MIEDDCQDSPPYVVPLTVDFEPKPAPPGWSWRLLTDLARLESGHTPSRDHPEWWGGDIPWIALPDIRALDGRIAFETNEYTNEQGIANSSARVLPAGTVVLSRTASVGFVTVMGRPMATSQDFVNWVCGPELDPNFLALLLRASRDYVRGLSSGATHKTVYVLTVNAFQVCLPPFIQQKRIFGKVADMLERVEDARVAAEMQVEAGRRLRSAYLNSVLGDYTALEWPRERLGDLLMSPLKTGISKSGSPSSDKRCLTLSAVRDGLVDLTATKPASVTDSEAKGNWLKPNAFYVVRGNGNRGLVGRGGLAPEVIPDPVLYPDLLIEVNPDPRKLAGGYLRLVWDSESVRQDIEGRARTSAGIYKINQENLWFIRNLRAPP